LSGKRGDIRVSIPHRYAENFPTRRGLVPPFSFQFLIGTLKTSQRYPLSNSSTVVSIPHRYAENGGLNEGRKSIKMFQFLIGTLKTDSGDMKEGRNPLSFNSS